MWNSLVGYLPEATTIFYTVLSFLIPYVIYKVSRLLRKYMDQTWKKDRPE